MKEEKRCLVPAVILLNVENKNHNIENKLYIAE